MFADLVISFFFQEEEEEKDILDLIIQNYFSYKRGVGWGGLVNPFIITQTPVVINTAHLFLVTSRAP